MAVLIEVLSRSGRVLERHRFEGPSVSVGRGYDNDLILSDPYVDELQLAIDSADGKLTLRRGPGDAPIHVGRDAAGDGYVLRSGDEITVGRTRLKVLTPDHSVGPTLTLKPLDALFMRVAEPTGFLLALAVYVGISALDRQALAFARLDVTDIVVDLVTPLALFMAWAGMWALISRVTRHEPRFFYHAWAVLIYLVLMMGGEWMIRIATFNTNSLDVDWMLSNVIGLAAFWVLFWLNLRFAFQLSAAHRHLVAGGAALAIIGYGILSDVAGRPEFSRAPDYTSTMLPRALLLRDGVDTGRFVEDAGRVFEFADVPAAAAVAGTAGSP